MVNATTLSQVAMSITSIFGLALTGGLMPIAVTFPGVVGAMIRMPRALTQCTGLLIGLGLLPISENRVVRPLEM